jgi:hypothetical protein
MAKLLLLCAAGIATLGAFVRHLHLISLAVIIFSTAFLLAVFGLVLWIRRPLIDFLEELRRSAET